MSAPKIPIDNPDNLVIRIIPDENSKSGFVVTPNSGHIQRGHDIIWLPTGTAVKLIFGETSPFAGVTIDIPDGGAGTQSVSQDASLGPFSYGVFSQTTGVSIEGDDGNDPTIIVD